MPQHVDTSALIYRPDVMRDAGVTSVPDRPEDAWSWEEFGEVAQKVADAAPDGSSAFGVNWQALGAFRWLNFLFQAGGHAYAEDLTRAIIDSPEGRRALEFTASFFKRGWVSGSTSTKAATYPDSLCTSGTLGMLYAGNFLLPAFAETIKDRFEHAVPTCRATNGVPASSGATPSSPTGRHQPRPRRGLPRLHGGTRPDAGLLRRSGAAADPDARPAPRLRRGRRPHAGRADQVTTIEGPRRRRRHHGHLRRGQPGARQRARAVVPRRPAAAGR